MVRVNETCIGLAERAHRYGAASHVSGQGHIHTVCGTSHSRENGIYGISWGGSKILIVLHPVRPRRRSRRDQPIGRTWRLVFYTLSVFGLGMVFVVAL